MLLGQYKAKLTDKNRISVPKRFREELGSEMVIAKWYEKCLVLVSKANWQRLIKRLTGKTEIITSPVRDIDRFIFGSAFEIDLDSQGRFVLPESLKDYSDVKTEVFFIGLGDRVEIWPAETWTNMEKEAEKKASEAIEKLNESTKGK